MARRSVHNLEFNENKKREKLLKTASQIDMGSSEPFGAGSVSK